MKLFRSTRVTGALALAVIGGVGAWSLVLKADTKTVKGANKGALHSGLYFEQDDDDGNFQEWVPLADINPAYANKLKAAPFLGALSSCDPSDADKCVDMYVYDYPVHSSARKADGSWREDVKGAAAIYDFSAKGTRPHRICGDERQTSEKFLICLQQNADNYSSEMSQAQKKIADAVAEMNKSIDVNDRVSPSQLEGFFANINRKIYEATDKEDQKWQKWEKDQVAQWGAKCGTDADCLKAFEKVKRLSAAHISVGEALVHAEIMKTATYAVAGLPPEAVIVVNGTPRYGKGGSGGKTDTKGSGRKAAAATGSGGAQKVATSTSGLTGEHRDQVLPTDTTDRRNANDKRTSGHGTMDPTRAMYDMYDRMAGNFGRDPIQCPDYIPREDCNGGGKFDPTHYQKKVTTQEYGVGIDGRGAVTQETNFNYTPSNGTAMKDIDGQFMEGVYDAVRPDFDASVAQFVADIGIQGYLAKAALIGGSDKFDSYVDELAGAGGASCKLGGVSAKDYVRSQADDLKRVMKQIDGARDRYRNEMAVAAQCTAHILPRLKSLAADLGADGKALTTLKQKAKDEALFAAKSIAGSLPGGGRLTNGAERFNQWYDSKTEDGAGRYIGGALDGLLSMPLALPVVGQYSSAPLIDHTYKCMIVVHDRTDPHYQSCMSEFNEYMLLKNEVQTYFSAYPLLQEKDRKGYAIQELVKSVDPRVSGYNSDLSDPANLNPDNPNSIYEFDPEGHVAGIRNCMAHMADASKPLMSVDEKTGKTTVRPIVKADDASLKAVDDLLARKQDKQFGVYKKMLKDVCSSPNYAADAALTDPTLMSMYYSCQQNKFGGLSGYVENLPDEWQEKSVSKAECSARHEGAWVACRAFREAKRTEEKRDFAQHAVQLAFDTMVSGSFVFGEAGGGGGGFSFAGGARSGAEFGAINLAIKAIVGPSASENSAKGSVAAVSALVLGSSEGYEQGLQMMKAASEHNRGYADEFLNGFVSGFVFGGVGEGGSKADRRMAEADREWDAGKPFDIRSVRLALSHAEAVNDAPLVLDLLRRSMRPNSKVAFADVMTEVFKADDHSSKAGKGRSAVVKALRDSTAEYGESELLDLYRDYVSQNLAHGRNPLSQKLVGSMRNALRAQAKLRHPDLSTKTLDHSSVQDLYQLAFGDAGHVAGPRGPMEAFGQDPVQLLNDLGEQALHAKSAAAKPVIRYVDAYTGKEVEAVITGRKKDGSLTLAYKKGSGTIDILPVDLALTTIEPGSLHVGKDKVAINPNVGVDEMPDTMDDIRKYAMSHLGVAVVDEASSGKAKSALEAYRGSTNGVPKQAMYDPDSGAIYVGQDATFSDVRKALQEAERDVVAYRRLDVMSRHLKTLEVHATPDQAKALENLSEKIIDYTDLLRKERSLAARGDVEGVQALRGEIIAAKKAVGQAGAKVQVRSRAELDALGDVNLALESHALQSTMLATDMESGAVADRETGKQFDPLRKEFEKQLIDVAGKPEEVYALQIIEILRKKGWSDTAIRDKLDELMKACEGKG